MKVTCNNPKNYALTRNNEYEVLRQEGDFLIIINDNDRAQRYSAELFGEVQEEPIAPAAPVVPRTEADMINSIRIDGDGTMVFNDLQNDEIFIEPRIDTSDRMEASCGIGDCFGIDEVCIAIDEVVNDLDDDYIALRKALLTKRLEYDIENPEEDRGMFIISTAINNIDDRYIEVLDLASDTQSDVVRNPNSGNQIKAWIFNK